MTMALTFIGLYLHPPVRFLAHHYLFYATCDGFPWEAHLWQRHGPQRVTRSSWQSCELIPSSYLPKKIQPGLHFKDNRRKDTQSQVTIVGWTPTTWKRSRTILGQV